MTDTQKIIDKLNTEIALKLIDLIYLAEYWFISPIDQPYFLMKDDAIDYVNKNPDAPLMICTTLVDYKLNNVKKSNKSYYHPHKKAIFMNKGFLLRCCNSKRHLHEDASKIFAMVLHELTHALIDIKYNADGIHTHVHIFYALYIDILSDASGIKKETFTNKRITNGDYRESLRELVSTDNYLIPISNKHFFRFGVFNSPDNAINALKQQFKIDASLSDNFVLDRDTETIEHYFLDSDPMENIFPDYTVYIFSVHDKVHIHIQKTLKYHLNRHELYKKYLTNKYKHITKKASV